MTLSEYYEELKNHDWYYSFSDDQEVWKKGQQKHEELLKLSRNNTVFAKLYDDFNMALFSGSPWGTEKVFTS